MEEADVISMISDTLMTTLIASAPVLIVALGVGLLVAFFQALTQIQEMTLTFVPKIVGIFLAIIVFLPFMYYQLEGLTNRIFDIIVSGGL